MSTTIQTVGEFEYGLEVTRDVYGFEFEFDFQYGRAKISFPNVNGKYAGHNEVVEPPKEMGFDFSLRDLSAPPHIPDLTWGIATSHPPESAHQPGPIPLLNGYIYRYLISIIISDSSKMSSHLEMIEEAKVAFSKYLDWFEVMTNQDVVNGSAPISQSKSTQIWVSEPDSEISPSIDANCSYRTVIEGHPLKLADVQSAIYSRTRGEAPNPSLILLRDSRRAFHNLDFRDSVLLSGVAAEVTMAKYLLSAIESGIDIGIDADELQFRAGLGQIYDLWQIFFKSDSSAKFSLNKRLRNDVAHRGKSVTSQQSLDFYRECEFILEQTLKANSHQ